MVYEIRFDVRGCMKVADLERDATTMLSGLVDDVDKWQWTATMHLTDDEALPQIAHVTARRKRRRREYEDDDF